VIRPTKGHSAAVPTQPLVTPLRIETGKPTMCCSHKTKLTIALIVLGWSICPEWLTLNSQNRACAQAANDKTKDLVEKLQAKSRDSRQAEVHQQLDTTTITVDFDAVPLKDVLDFLGEKLKADMHLSRVSQSQKNVLITLRLKHKPVTVRTVLDLVLDQLDAPNSYLIRDGVVLITDQDQALVTQIHDCHDLIEAARKRRQPITGSENTDQAKIAKEPASAQAPGGVSMMFGTGIHFQRNQDVNALIDVIQNIVQSESWKETGGEGAIESYDDRLLIVKHTSSAQQEIAELLEMLRAKEPSVSPQSK
jgi:hypothetical protein